MNPEPDAAHEQATTAIPLNQANLAAIAERSPEVELPAYDRTKVTVGMVHFGVGGFHRAHQAMYLDRLMNQGKALDWGLCGVGVLPGDERMKNVMANQDCLYTLVTKAPDGTQDPRVIGSIVEYLFAPDDPNAVIERIAHPDTKIVSLTVTEGGYNFNQSTGEFDSSNPAIRADLDNPTQPRTVFGLVTEAIKRRRASGAKPLTIMSCDNIQGNGHIAEAMFTSFAELSEPGLGEWMRANMRFPNSMVDRITPVTTPADIEMVAADYGIADEWPVVSEDFTQWVLEDSFTDGRPPYEDAGVQVVADVEPYEFMKLRLLNASHQGMAYFGRLAGYTYAHEVAQDPAFAAFLRAYMDREATPTLRPVPGIDLDEYKTQLIERFSNAHIKDTVARLAAESSDRIPKWLVPVIIENLKNDGELLRSAGIVASWARYAEGTDEAGAAIEVVDRLREERMAAAASQGEDALAFVRNQELFGPLAGEPRFVEAYQAALAVLHQRGAKATIELLT